MDTSSRVERAVELLQQLGLKEYEAKSFVALSRLPRATAKEISEHSDVPRTRVYDAVRVLEAKGLVEKQHSSPQQFRAVPNQEATKTLQAEYKSRTEALYDVLADLEPASTAEESDITHEVWALSGAKAIANRTDQLLAQADEEVVIVIGDEMVLTDRILEGLLAAQQGGVSVIIGATSEPIRDRVQQKLPEANVFISGLEWLSQSALAGDETEISRLLLVDRKTILTSTFHTVNGNRTADEQGVFGHGFDNGLVTIIRRLMATGLLPADDPGVTEL